MLYQSITGQIEKHKYVVCLTISGIENIEMFDNNGTLISKEIRSNVKQHIYSTLKLPKDSISDFNTNVFLFNYHSYQTESQITNRLLNFQQQLASSIEIQLIVGISSYKHEAEKQLAQKKALYNLHLSKLRNSKNSLSYHSITFENAIRSYELELIMPNAFSNNEFQVVYQPIISNKGHISLEALLRWTHQGQNIPPDVFIHIAERSSLIYQLTYLVIKNALDTLQNHPEIEFISINLAPVTLYSPNWLLRFLKPFEEKKPELTQRLCWEITEVSKLNEDHWSSIKELRKSGQKIFIDDFGEGHTSFNYLLKSIDTVKIDKSIPKITNGIPSKYLKSMIQLCKDMNLKIVLEGIETEAEFKAFKDCDILLQGYFISMPLIKEKIPHFITKFKEELI